MIKRFRFVARAGPPGGDRWAEAWRRAAGAAGSAPDGTRPVRIAVCPVLPDERAPHDGVGIEWFADVEHAARFEAWSGTDEGQAAQARLGAVVDLAASPVLLAEESVLRGPEWLEKRWEKGGERLKHMALARRAAGLTPELFSARWRSRAGMVGSSSGQTVRIPDAARGCAYIQDHPLPGPPEGWVYDAVNEVYFEDRASLRLRVEWFAGNLAGGTEDDLVSESWFLAVRELLAGPLL